MSLILAIESSCDETSAAVIQDGLVLSNVIAGQSVHQAYGGVVPELASRAHQAHIVPVVDQALKQANIQKNRLDAVAFTKGPGLLGALLVGASFAKAMALALRIPLIGVHHMRAHILAHFIEDPKPAFPFLCLTVSGGHTQLVLVQGPLDMEIIGETLDDAVGEAFDKTAKLIGLPYPGGPLIDRYAQQGNPDAFQFAKIQFKDLNFSFSGIKTAVLYFLKEQVAANPSFIQDHLADICASVQKTLVNLLVSQLDKAVKDTGVKHIGIAGGVSANSELRKAVQQYGIANNCHTYIPSFAYCTDNAAMIAMAAHFLFEAGIFDDQGTTPMPRYPFA